MKWHVTLIAVLLISGPAALAAPTSQPASQPTTQELPLPELKRVERTEHEKDLAKLPQLPAHKLSDLFELAVQNGDLIIKPKAGRTDRSRVELEGFNGPADIMIGGDEAKPN